jgi:hypothetical protein
LTPETYRSALTSLGLTQQAAGRWLRVSPKTAQNYAKHGPSGPAAVAVEMALQLRWVLTDMLAERDMIEIDDWIAAVSQCVPIVAVREKAALKGEAG